MPQLRDLKVGDMFRRTPTSKATLVRGHYDKGSKKYACSHYDDVNREVFIKGNKPVFTDFEF